MSSTPERSEIVAYYRDPAVRRQMARFLGGESPEQATAAYITGSDPGYLQYEPRPVADLFQCMDEGLDIGRSLWDRQRLLAHLDIDYVNFTFPAEAHVHVQRTFGVLQPVLDTACSLLREHGISPLHLLSGCGHHLIWSVSQQSEAFGRLADIGRLSESLRGRYRQVHQPPGWSVSTMLGRAHAGLGLLMEFLAHRVIERSAPHCPAPVEATAVRVGAGTCGSEEVSVDISEYADPLHLRTIRSPFSVYFKPQHRRDVLGNHVVAGLPPLFLIPLQGIDLADGLEIMRSVDRVKELARLADIGIPETDDPTGTLIDAYCGSDLAAFHDWFYSEDPEPPQRWPATYDALDLTCLPPCGRSALQHPRDLLMQPGRIQHVVRLLLARGWHPRHIAGLIRSKYERDFGWGGYWYHYDATSRADCYTRLFAGLLLAGCDDLVDFNCRSTQEKGYCAVDRCDGSLDGFRDALLKRRSTYV